MFGVLPALGAEIYSGISLKISRFFEVSFDKELEGIFNEARRSCSISTMNWVLYRVLRKYIFCEEPPAQ